MLNRINKVIKKQNEKSDDIKKRIIETAENMLAESSVKEIKMDAIAEWLGIAKKTIYGCFVSKSELIHSLIAKQLTDYKTELEQKKQEAANSIEQAYLSWHIFQRFMFGFTPSLREELYKNYIQSYVQLSHFINHYLHQHLKSNIERGITAGLYRENVNPDIIAKYLVPVLMQDYKVVSTNYSKLPSVEAEREILSYHLHAIATPKGTLLIEKYKNDYLAYASVML